MKTRLFRFAVLILAAIWVSSFCTNAIAQAVADPPATEAPAADTPTDDAPKKLAPEKPAPEKPAPEKLTKEQKRAKRKAKREKEAEGPLYMRIHKDEAGKQLAMQTAIVKFVGKKGTSYEGHVVDLVGVVHIGQLEYYKDLDKRLGKYDTVLYELVAPDGTRIRPEDLQKRRSILASMQTGMKDMLNLEYQLERIDYMAKNFRHADMSPTEFSEDLERRGDSIWKMGARMMGAGLASQASSGGDMGLLFAYFSKDRSKKMKQTMARQLVDIDLVTAGMDDANGENTLIKGRNEKAFKILREELDAGKKNISVFYGAGHLPDMAKRLKEDFRMRSKSTVWLDAWDLTRN